MLPCQAVSRTGARCTSPGLPRGGSVIVDPGSRVCLQERAGRPPGSPALLLVADDRGDILGRNAVQVQVHMDLCGHEVEHC
jgi:hypothetical protein